MSSILRMIVSSEIQDQNEKFWGDIFYKYLELSNSVSAQSEGFREVASLGYYHDTGLCVPCSFSSGTTLNCCGWEHSQLPSSIFARF